MTTLYALDAIAHTDLPHVGGKALSLGLLFSAGLPVPPGFCLTTAVHRQLRGRRLADEPSLRAAVVAAFRALRGPVAVRSSATAEDGAETSFAGQQETILGVADERQLDDAIERCWASLDGERAVAYRQHQGVSESNAAMAVVVQWLVPAEVAGVLFTRDPLDPSGSQMLVEASWGLGESVVSGRVTPDRFHLERTTGRIIDRHVSIKTVRRTEVGEEPVPHEMQGVACLDEDQLARLAELGRKVEAFYGEPRDVEWAFAQGRFWLLQARPITADTRAERESVRQEEIHSLTAKSQQRGTVWSRYNLSEILPEPTPMTWAIVQRHLMSGKGGFGQMYREMGYSPSPRLDEEGVFDLVCGRPYCNLSREPLLYGEYVPLEHNFKALKADPRRALYPTPTLAPARDLLTLLSMPLWLPRMMWDEASGGRKRRRLLQTFAGNFRDEIAPAFKRATERAEVDLAGYDDNELLQRFNHWLDRALGRFASDSLKPTALAALALASLEEKLCFVMEPERASETARDLVMGVHPDPEADLPGAMRRLAQGELSRPEFLARFGHRGSEEMELSRPRWAEDPDSLERIPLTTAGREVPSVEQRLAAIPRLADFQREILLNEAHTVHTYLALRETGKHYLMYGYALIRRFLCEIDRRMKLKGGIFFLTPDELPKLLRGEDVSGLIAKRRRRRILGLGLEVPAVLFSDDLDAIGRPIEISGADLLDGVPVSAGVAEGPALVLEHPVAEASEGYILVCPSTDPAWVPLFVRARGLVMETGGVLSHGAIVAREFGLPAVAGVPGVMRRVRTGQRLHVDGGRGTVSVLE